MKLVDLFKEERIIPEFKATSIREALSALLEKLDDDLRAEARDEILNSLVEQESKNPTLINTSIWLPHLRSQGVKSICVCLAIAHNGLELKTSQGTNLAVKLIFLVLTPQTENTMMLQTLSAIARLCLHRDTLEAVLHIRVPQRVLRLIADTGIEVKKTILVRDVMETNFPCLREDMNLRQATEMIVRSGLEALCVVSENEELCGELSLTELIRLGLPEYVALLQDMSFVESLEPFEDFFHQERQLLVQQVYSMDCLTVSPDSLVVEAAYKLIANNKTQLYVVQDRKVVGILTLSLIARKILLL